MKSPNLKSLHHVLSRGYFTSCNAKNDRNYANYDSSGDPSAESFGNWFRFLVHMTDMTLCSWRRGNRFMMAIMHLASGDRGFSFILYIIFIG